VGGEKRERILLTTREKKSKLNENKLDDFMQFQKERRKGKCVPPLALPNVLLLACRMDNRVRCGGSLAAEESHFSSVELNLSARVDSGEEVFLSPHDCQMSAGGLNSN
jgi:hypothetical protein